MERDREMGNGMGRKELGNNPHSRYVLVLPVYPPQRRE
jgi:hypothetical protein